MGEKSLRIRERLEDVTLLALKIEKRSRSKPLEVWKDIELDSFLEPLKGTQS